VDFFLIWKFRTCSQNKKMLVCFLCVALLLRWRLVQTKAFPSGDINESRLGQDMVHYISPRQELLSIQPFWLELEDFPEIINDDYLNFISVRHLHLISIIWTLVDYFCWDWRRGSAEKASGGIFSLEKGYCSGVRRVVNFLTPAKIMGYQSGDQIVSSIWAGTIFCVSLYPSLYLAWSWQMSGIVNMQ
jgi:hypothetical protein